MIARFNLRVTQVYRGLLLGTGPQVDPGLRGHLGCPIHNFTDEEKTIEFLESLVTIDFEKTTPLGGTYFAGRNVEQITPKEYESMRSGVITVEGLHGLRCKIFNKRAGASFQSYLPGGQSVRSSVAALQEDLRKAQREIALYRTIGIGTLVTFLVAAFALYANVKDDISNRYMDLKNNIVELSKTVGQLEATIPGSLTVQPPPKHPQTEDKSQPATEQEVEPKRPAGKPVQ